MRAAIVSTYPPRPCGIATFARDLTEALRSADATLDVDVIAIVREPTAHLEPDVLAVIGQDVLDDYIRLPSLLDDRSVDVVLIEHEFGIFGGDAGSHLLPLVRDLRQPFVLTLHTVLAEPSPEQASVLRELCARAAFVTVFTETARRMVVDAGLVGADNLRVVPHGAPVELFPDYSAPRANPPCATRRVLSTFGLISEGKGIEVAVRALADIVRDHPEVVYLIAGQTHPEVAKERGEKYRLSLERLVRELGLSENVRFLDHFLTVHELADLLASTDIYLTPYRGREQIVSGALTFAVVAGCPVVSTPYYYAEDLLSSGAGVLVPFDDHRALARAVCSLLDDPAKLAAAGEHARRVGADLAWPAVGRSILSVLKEAVLKEAVSTGSDLTSKSAARYFAAPASIRSDHLLTLVDDVGIIQHAEGVVPLRAAGYCVDDVARMVIVALGLSRDGGLGHDQAFSRMVTSGLSFLRHAWDPDRAALHNFLSYDRSWIDQPHSGDHVGRAIWALGSVIAARPDDALGDASLRFLQDLAPAMDQMDSLREIAFAVMGLCRTPLTMLPPELYPRLERLAGRLLDAYSVTADDEWRWFENTLTYDNARLPQALLAAGERLNNQKMIDAGVASLDWYAEQCALDTPVVRLPGNSWRRRGDSAPNDGDGQGDEQPLDAAALVECCVDALHLTGTTSHRYRAVRAFEWFLGRNSSGIPVYDVRTGGCHDGLGPQGINKNQGAESTLAFFQALLALKSARLHCQALPG